MAGYSVEFFKNKKGRYPAKEYIDQWPEEHQAKIANVIALLQEQGPMLRRPYADSLRDKIYELRPSFGGHRHRILYSFDGKTIVLTHGFLKKTAEVPSGEIDFAIRCMREWFERKGKPE